MAHQYSVAEARANLPGIIDQAEAGEPVELTRRGKPVAVVVSLREFERLQRARPGFAAAYRAFLETHDLREVGVDTGFAATLRDRGAGRKVRI